jgi:DHA1 family multidrug resistance protein-like MFS transporter
MQTHDYSCSGRQFLEREAASDKYAGLHSWQRNFHAVWPSLFATSMGLMAFLPVLALYVRDSFAISDPTEQTIWGGLIYGAAPLAAAIAGPVWGFLGDRHGKKRAAIRANLAIAVTTALMPFAPNCITLLSLRVLQGIFAGYVAPAIALVSQDTPQELHGRVIAWLQVAMAAGSFVGPLLGAEITHWWGRAALFWVTSLLAAIGALQLWLRAREVEPVRGPSIGVQALCREMAASARSLLVARAFACLLLLVLLLRLGQNMLEPFVVLFVRELGPQGAVFSFTTDGAATATPAQRELALDRTVSVAFATLAVAQFACTPLWGRLADRHGPLRCLATLGSLLGLVLAATAMVATIDQFLVLRCVAACFMAGSMTLAYAAVSKRVVRGRRTLAFSLVQSCMQLGFAVGPMIGAGIAAIGATAEYANLRLAFAVAGGLCSLAGAGMFWLRRRSAEPLGSGGGTSDDVPACRPAATATDPSGPE